jgi:predicted MFS family arabinose efflux permease
MPQGWPVSMSIPSSERRVVWLLALVQLVNVLDFMMVMPLGPDFAKALTIDESHLGYIGGSYTMAAALSGVISARFLDRFDRRRALAVTMAGLSLGTLAGGLAVDFETLVGARVLAGIFGGPATSLSMAIVADVVPPERRGRAMGVVGSAFAVCSVVGVPAGLMLARVSWNTPFFAVAGLGLIITVVSIALLPPLRGHLGITRPENAATNSELVRRPEVFFSLLTIAVLMFSIFAIVPNLSAYAQHNYGYPRDRLELLYMVGGVVSFAVLRVTGGSVDRYGSTPVAAVGTVVFLVIVGIGVLPAAAPLVPLMVVYAVFMSTGTLRSVPLQALSSRLPAPHERAQLMSLQSVVQHLSASFAAFVGAKLLSQGPDGHLLHMPQVIAFSAVAALALPFCLWQVERRVRARPAVAPAVSRAA